MGVRFSEGIPASKSGIQGRIPFHCQEGNNQHRMWGYGRLSPVEGGLKMQNQPPVILIVDNDPDMCCNMSDILGDWDYEVDTALEGATALRMVRRRPYDIVLLDLRMPGSDGLTLSRQITRLRPETVAMLITAYPAEVGSAEVRAAGLRRVIAKPVNIPRLLEHILEDLADRSVPRERRTDRRRQLCVEIGV